MLGLGPGEGWVQIGDLTVALLLSSFIGLEREIRHKAAGLRTYTIVGFAAALFVLVSKYGFSDVVRPGYVVLDPSRVSAQIVSGIGFLGGGIIFVRHDGIQGITTAAGIWLTAAIGMAAGAGLPLLATFSVVAYFVVAYGLRPVAARLRGEAEQSSVLLLRYLDGHGILRVALERCTKEGFAVRRISTAQTGLANQVSLGGTASAEDDEEGDEATVTKVGVVDLRLTLVGTRPVEVIVAALTGIDGMVEVAAAGSDEEDD